MCASTGNLLLVSSAESSIGEFTPDGAFVATHALPAGVSSLSGIGLDEGSGEVWVAGTGGLVWRLGGAPCAASLVPALPVGHSRYWRSCCWAPACHRSHGAPELTDGE